MTNYKKIFDEMTALTEKYTLIFGSCYIDSCEGKYIIASKDMWINVDAGKCDEELAVEAIREIEEFCEDVKTEGYYKFRALLTYDSAQTGNYPPPNIELPAYHTVEYIEFKLSQSKEEIELQAEESEIYCKDDLPF